MIGSVYVSDSNKQGKNFKLTTGTNMAFEDNTLYDGVLILPTLVEFCLI